MENNYEVIEESSKGGKLGLIGLGLAAAIALGAGVVCTIKSGKKDVYEVEDETEEIEIEDETEE